MAEGVNPIQQFRSYSPTKGTLVVACLAAVGLTMLVGFTWGGWVTEGTATERVNEAVTQARAELASAVCVGRFLAATDARKRLEELKATNSWEQDDLIEKAGWSTPPGIDAPVEDAAGLCATQLAEMTLPAEDAGTKPTASATPSSLAPVK